MNGGIVDGRPSTIFPQIFRKFEDWKKTIIFLFTEYMKPMKPFITQFVRVLLLSLLGLVLTLTYTQAQQKKNKKSISQMDRKGGGMKKDTIMPYNKIVTAKAITDEGLFHVHKVGDKYYFELPWRGDGKGDTGCE